jgi:site-specific recombinase XerD
MNNQHNSITAGFKHYLQSKGFASSGIASRLAALKRYQKWLTQQQLQAEQITYNELLGFMQWCSRKGASQRTIQHYIGSLRHVYDYLIRDGKVDKNPVADITVKGVKRKVLYHILETHTLHALYHKYPVDTHSDRRNKVMLGMLVYQGLKTTELRKLSVQDVKLREGKLHVPGSNSSNSREMLLEPPQIMDLYDYTLQVRPLLMQMESKRKHQGKTASDDLFIAEGGKQSSRGLNTFMRQLMLTLKAHNPQVVSVKQIRASVITKWLKMYNLREVQYLAGHRYISSTESYLQNDMQGLQEEIQQFHPLG